MFCGQISSDGGMPIAISLPWPNVAPNDLAGRVAGNVMMQPPAIAGLPSSNTVQNTLAFDTNGQLTSIDWSGHTTDGNQAGYSYTSIVSPLSYNSPISLAAGTQGTPYTPVTVRATGGTLPYTYSLQSGAWPTGMTLNASTGVISGTPTASGTFSPNIKVCDSEGTPACVTSGALSLVIASNAGPLVVTTTTCPDANLNVVYPGCTLSATGGVLPFTWDLASGSLPAGLAIYGNVILGTPTALGVSTFTPRVTDSDSPATTASSAAPVTITVGNKTGATIGAGVTFGSGVVLK